MMAVYQFRVSGKISVRALLLMLEGLAMISRTCMQM